MPLVPSRNDFPFNVHKSKYNKKWLCSKLLYDSHVVRSKDKNRPHSPSNLIKSSFIENDTGDIRFVKFVTQTFIDSLRAECAQP